MEAAVAEKKKLAAKDYKSEIKPIWCPGCGDYSVLNALTRALAEMALINRAGPFVPPAAKPAKFEAMAVAGTLIVYGAAVGIHYALGYPTFG